MGRQVGYFTDEVQVRISRMVCFVEVTVVNDFVDVVALSLLIRGQYLCSFPKSSTWVKTRCSDFECWQRIEVVGNNWSALEDDFRTFLLSGPIGLGLIPAH